MDRLRPGPALIQRAALVTALALGAIVVTGGAVRLSGSGLGCPTWPDCAHGSVVGGHGLHYDVELGNRFVTVAVFLAVAATAALVLLAKPRRRDLCWLAGGLVAGFVAQAVLGGITVLTRLNPLTVAAHFLLSMVLLWNALVLLRRSGQQPVPAVPVVRGEVRILGRCLVGLAAAVLVIGTLVTGSGPHAGARVDNRLPFALRDIAQLHSDVVLLLVGATAATLVLLRVTDAPPAVRRRGRWLLAVMLAQTVVGFTQYFTGLPAGLVEVHILGATLVWVTVLLFVLELTERPALAPPPAQSQRNSRAAAPREMAAQTASTNTS
ncbi:MAG: COX15/CtaA family protein [Mycobacteriales bacterium]